MNYYIKQKRMLSVYIHSLLWIRPLLRNRIDSNLSKRTINVYVSFKAVRCRQVQQGLVLWVCHSLKGNIAIKVI